MASAKAKTNTSNNSLETYSIVWLDASVNNDENMGTQNKLRSIVNQLVTFINPDEFLKHVALIQQGDLTILIVSGQLGRIVVPDMQKLEQQGMCLLFFECIAYIISLLWVKAVCNKLDELIDVIRVDQKHRSRNEESLGIDILDRSSTELNGDFLHSKLLIDVLIRMKSNEQDQNEFIELLKTEYKGNEAELSYYGEETEILFMTGSIFRLEAIRQDDSLGDVRIWMMRMSLCGDDENDLKELYDHMKKEYGLRNETNLMSLGFAMWKMGKFDLAEKYYRQCLSELPSNYPSLRELYQHIGLVANSKGEYDSSLKWYEKSLEMRIRTSPSDYVNIGNTHNNIGNAHRNKGDYIRALESYNRAVSLFKEAHDENHPKMAWFYNNIASIYFTENKYLEALDFYEKTLAIDRKHLPADHADFGDSYNNIGIVHRHLGHYDLALEYYDRSIKISLKSLPSQHPTIADSYENMSLVYEDKGELEHTLKLLKKSQLIYEVALPVNHPTVLRINNNVKLVEDKIKRKK
ncbi:unnamed protein product [Rotaria magnacalcarata]|uniref:Uncharacterized protein n=2 Tax=Rotaria magnacalcarata TaxID=392030 RepID=A0A820D520_9BILA|nr:unnamed protein product [Rotaria magnacalcarata]